MYPSPLVYLPAVAFCLVNIAQWLKGSLCGGRGCSACWKCGVHTSSSCMHNVWYSIHSISINIWDSAGQSFISAFLPSLCYSENSSIRSILFVLTARSVRLRVLSDSLKHKVEISEYVIICGGKMLSKVLLTQDLYSRGSWEVKY